MAAAVGVKEMVVSTASIVVAFVLDLCFSNIKVVNIDYIPEIQVNNFNNILPDLSQEEKKKSLDPNIFSYWCTPELF